MDSEHRLAAASVDTSERSGVRFRTDVGSSATDSVDESSTLRPAAVHRAAEPSTAIPAAAVRSGTVLPSPDAPRDGECPRESILAIRRNPGIQPTPAYDGSDDTTSTSFHGICQAADSPSQPCFSTTGCGWLAELSECFALSEDRVPGIRNF
jgi:hypothetical protein